MVKLNCTMRYVEHLVEWILLAAEQALSGSVVRIPFEVQDPLIWNGLSRATSDLRSLSIK